MSIAASLSGRLRAAESANLPVPPLSEIPAGDVDLAYEVQLASVEAWLREGRRLVGRKIGLTNPKVQAQLGVDRPDFGALFHDMRYDSGAAVAFGRVLQPRIEAEVAFELGSDLPDPAASREDVLAAVASVRAALEIVGSRIADWSITIVDTVADNASSGAFVLGAEAAAVGDVDLVEVTMELELTRHGTSSIVSTGSGRDCLGSPLVAAHWLAAELARRGDPLRAGDVVLTGALGPMVRVEPGDRFAATIAGLGSVAVEFSDEEP